MSNEDIRLQKLVEEEKKKITTDLGEHIRFLAYASDDGPSYEIEEPARTGIRKLKGTPLWTLMYPARKGYRAAEFVYKHGVSGVYHKAEGAVKRKVANSKYLRRKEARKFLTEIMPTEEEKQKQRERVFSEDIKISVLVPLFNTPEEFLRDMIASVTGQTYQNWELVLADASDAAHTEVAEIVKEYADADKRIVYKKLEKNAGIADNTNACIEFATGNYLALFDHDDVFHPSALYECAKAIEAGAEFVYTDEVTFEGDELENIITYHFKPDFSVDNLRGVNYICHLSVFKKSLVDEVGMFDANYDGSQDHDIIMRLTDAAKKVTHIPKVLYFWRCHKMSTAMNIEAKSYAIEAGRRAVRDAERRRGYPATVYSTQICKTHYRMDYKIENPQITVLVDGSGKSIEQLAHTIAAVIVRSTYQNYELRFAKNQEELAEEIQAAKGDYIAMIAAGVTPIAPTWLEELLMFAQRRDVGLTAMQIIDELNEIYSSDIVIGQTADTLALEVNRGSIYNGPGYMGRNYYAHNVSAISGMGCMAKTKILQIGWEKSKMESSYGKILQLCMELRLEDMQIVLNPYALAQVPKGEAPLELSVTEKRQLMETYKKQIEAGDPFYNKNLSMERFWQKK